MEFSTGDGPQDLVACVVTLKTIDPFHDCHGSELCQDSNAGRGAQSQRAARRRNNGPHNGWFLGAKYKNHITKTKKHSESGKMKHMKNMI